MQFHKIWIEQCEATRTIKEQYGVQNALDYLIGEKLIRFVAAAESRPEFAQELPEFLQEVRRIFTAEAIDEYLDSFERRNVLARVAAGEDEGETEDDFLANPIFEAEELLRFGRVKALMQHEQSQHE